MKHPILWIHGEALGPSNPALVAYPGRPAVFVFDTELLEGQTPAQPISLKRIGFLYECLLELPVTLRRGDVAEQVLAFAGAHGADGIVTSAATDPRFKAICRQLEPHLPLQVLEPEPFVVLEPEPNLGRFSRYWRQAERAVWAQWATAPGPR
jgi:deoxyribodipyrimidine photo-lyase